MFTRETKTSHVVPATRENVLVMAFAIVRADCRDCATAKSDGPDPEMEHP